MFIRGSAAAQSKASSKVNRHLIKRHWRDKHNATDTETNEGIIRSSVQLEKLCVTSAERKDIMLESAKLKRNWEFM